LACELLPRFLFIPYAIFQWLTDRQPSRSGNIELAIPRNVKLRHLVSDSYDQLRTHDEHRDRDRHYALLLGVLDKNCLSVDYMELDPPVVYAKTDKRSWTSLTVFA